jgi:hypothetical protein
MITELVIDRQKWGTGALKNEDGTMCCLGFLSEACGYGDQLRHIDVKGIDHGSVGLPNPLWIDVPPVFRDGHISEIATKAARINDSDRLQDEKEEALFTLFKNNGIKLSFVGEPRGKYGNK